MTRADADTRTDEIMRDASLKVIRENPGASRVIIVVDYDDGSQKMMEALLNENEVAAKIAKEEQQ